MRLNAEVSTITTFSTGINALVGSTFDPQASQATASGLGSMLGSIQKGVVSWDLLRFEYRPNVSSCFLN